MNPASSLDELLKRLSGDTQEPTAHTSVEAAEARHLEAFLNSSASRQEQNVQSSLPPGLWPVEELIGSVGPRYYARGSANEGQRASESPLEEPFGHRSSFEQGLPSASSDAWDPQSRVLYVKDRRSRQRALGHKVRAHRQWWPKFSDIGIPCTGIRPHPRSPDSDDRARAAVREARVAQDSLRRMACMVPPSSAASVAAAESPELASSQPFRHLSTELPAATPPSAPRQTPGEDEAAYTPRNRALYSMVLLDRNSSNRIRERVGYAFSKVSNDHMTLRFKPDDSHIQSLSLGLEVQLQACAVVANATAQALMISPHPDLECLNVPRPHVTVSVDNNSSFKSAGNLVHCWNMGSDGLQTTVLDPPLVLDGRIAVRLSNGETVFDGASVPSCPTPRTGRSTGGAGHSSSRPSSRGRDPKPVDRAYRAAESGNVSWGTNARFFGEGRSLWGAGEGTAAPKPEVTQSETPSGVAQPPACGYRGIGDELLVTPRKDAVRTPPPAGSGDVALGLDAMLGRLGISRDWQPQPKEELLVSPHSSVISCLPDSDRRLEEFAPPTDSSAVDAAATSHQHDVHALSGPGNARETSVSDAERPSDSARQVEELLEAWTSGMRVTAAESAAPACPSISPITAAASLSGDAATSPERSSTSVAAPSPEFQEEDQFWADILSSSKVPVVQLVTASTSNQQRSDPKDIGKGSSSLAKSSSKPARDVSRRQEKPTKKAVEGGALKASRPGRESVSRLWAPEGAAVSGASLHTGVKPKLPSKLLQRSDAVPPAVAAPGSGSETEGTVVGPTYTAWLQSLNEAGDGAAEARQPGTGVEAKSEGGGDPSDSSGMGEWRSVEAESGESGSEAHLFREAVRFSIQKAERRTPSLRRLPAPSACTAEATQPRGGDSEASDRLTGSGVKVVEISSSSSEGSSDDDDDICGGPWWTRKKLPKDGTKTLDSSRDGFSSGSSNPVDAYLRAWNQPQQTSPSMGEEQAKPSRRIFSLPQNALKLPVPVADPAKAPQAALEQGSSASGSTATARPEETHTTFVGISQEEFEKRVLDITSEFPDINPNVAEMTLKSYGGDLEEAITFLKMTALTATPAQVQQLGLQSARRPQNAGSRTFEKPRRLDPEAPIMAEQTAASASAVPGIMPSAAMPVPGCPAVVGDPASSLLSAADDEAAVALAISGAETTLAEQQRLFQESEAAREQSTRHFRTKAIYKAAAEQAESLGQHNTALRLKSLAHEQGILGRESRQKCNAKAFERANHGVTNRIKLDLHGMNVDEAIQELEKHILSLMGLSSATFVLQVVTGVGKHSLGGRAKLLPAVLSYVNANDLAWEEEWGNPGQINVVLAGAKAE